MSSAKFIEEPISSSKKFWSIAMGNARMAAIELSDGKLCLISPLARLKKDAFEEYTMSHLLAPNHYHNKALSEYADRYPAAQLCASINSKVRLEKVTGLAFKPLTAVKKKLPKGLAFIEPEGLKTGELWVKFPVDGQTGWYVIDAFTGRKMSATSLECKKPEMLKTFPSYGIADAEIYKKWVLKQIKKDKPVLVVPCHGSRIANPKLPTLLESLVKTV